MSEKGKISEEQEPSDAFKTDSEKLRLLAAWLERVYAPRAKEHGWALSGHGVEDDLRRIADQLEKTDAGVLAGLEIARKMAEVRVSATAKELMQTERDIGSGTLATEYCRGHNLSAATIHQNIAAEIARRNPRPVMLENEHPESYRDRFKDWERSQKSAGSGKQPTTNQPLEGERKKA